MKYFRLACRKR